MKAKLLIIGAGGHGKVVAETALLCGRWELIGFADDQFDPGTEVMPGLKVVCGLGNLETADFDAFVVAIGNNRIRCDIFNRLRKMAEPATLIHPFTSVSAHASLGAGSVVLAGAVLSFGVRIGENCIVGSNVHVDHECFVGDHSHLRNGSALGSNCILGPYCTTETGSGLKAFSRMETP